jgi:hypothetical protein
LFDVQELLQEKDKRIKELESQLKFKPSLVRQDGCYFDKEELEKNSYEPFCSSCWEVRNSPVHLTLISSVILTAGGNPRRLLSYFCPTCKNPFKIFKKLT